MEQNQELNILFADIYEQLKVNNYNKALEIIENSDYVNNIEIINITKLIKDILSKKFIHENSNFKCTNEDNPWESFYQYANHQNYLKAQECINKLYERYCTENQVNGIFLYKVLIERLCKKVEINKVIYDIDGHILSIAKGNCNQFLKILKIKELLNKRSEARQLVGYNNDYDVYTLQLIEIIEKLHDEKILQIDRIIYSKSISKIANFDKAFSCKDSETMCELMLKDDEIYDNMLKQRLVIYPLVLKKILLCYNKLKKDIDYKIEYKNKYSELIGLVQEEEYDSAINFCVKNSIGLSAIEQLITVNILKKDL